jgi:hypothetical protein
MGSCNKNNENSFFRYSEFGYHILTQNGFPSGPMTPTTRGLIVYHSSDACRVPSVGFGANLGTYRHPFVVILGTNLVSKFQNSETTF